MPLEAVLEGDTLIVWKLDRLGRSLGFLAELIAQFGKKGRGFIALQDGIDTTTTDGKLVFHIMASLAEFERDPISESKAQYRITSLHMWKYKFQFKQEKKD